MSPDEPISHWISQLQAGNREAVSPVWQRYFGQLVALARHKLHCASRAAADEEDVALSAFNSVCLGLEQGRFPQLLDREGLWRLLVVVTERKAIDLKRRQGSRKRGGGQVLGESVLDALDDSTVGGGMSCVPDTEPDAALAALLAEECQRLLSLLDNRLQHLALLKMEGYTNEEIAARLDCGVRTVERKLKLIRVLWERGSSS
jgi:DNA-directed RNA polymerase specialized sigma24 family protein